MEAILSDGKVLDINRLLTKEAIDAIDSKDDLKIYLKGVNAMCDQILAVIDEVGCRDIFGDREEDP